MPKKDKSAAKAAKAAKAASAAVAKTVDNQKLPPAEDKLFKDIGKFYEQKQYKKAVKVADTILRKCPEHGETLAMKGLNLSMVKGYNKEEVDALIKKGLVKNSKSPVCWHVYGLWYRQNHEYDRAVKCYQNAIRIEPDNLNILKDMSHLQVQRRKYAGFVETRRKILLLKAANRQNWIAYAVANHLALNHKECIQVLDSYWKTADTKSKSNRYENSELVMYKAQVLEESGELQEALDHLAKWDALVVDRLGLRHQRARLHTQLGRPEQAVAEWRALLDTNCENLEFHQGLQRAMGIGPGADGRYNPEHVDKLTALYKELQDKFPRCAAVQQIPLTFLQGESFQAAVSQYLQERLAKGVPSVFRDLRPLYNDKNKTDIITQLVQDTFYAELKAHQRFTPDQPKGSQFPSALQWTLYFLGQHHDRLGDHAQALHFADLAVTHTPTNIDAHMLKARVLKHAGDWEEAYVHMDTARKLDLADRYLNVKCTRYALRAGKVKDAETTVALFLRDGDSLTSLYDMQCSWYALSTANCYLKQGDRGKALKQLHAVHEHFNSMFEDQFDFHTYCLRKMTLRAYVALLRWEDSLQSHRFYFKAAQALVRTYVDLDAHPPPPESEEETAERRRAEQADASKDAQLQKKLDQISGKPNDPDPLGLKLLREADPLKQALFFQKQLELFSAHEAPSLLSGVLLYTRLQKWLLVCLCLKRLAAKHPSSPDAHLARLKYLHTMSNQPQLLASLPEAVQTVLQIENKQLTSGKSLLELNTEFGKQHKSLPARLAVAEAMVLLDSKQTKAAVAHVTVKLETIAPKPDWTDAEAVLSFLDRQKANKEAAAWKAQCANFFPLTPCFRTDKA